MILSIIGFIFNAESMRYNLENIVFIADQFNPQGKVLNVQDYGQGNINDTFLVTLDSGQERHFILQRINTQVFRQPELIMQNMRVLTEHVSKRIYDLNIRWETPRVLLTRKGSDHFIDSDGAFWRALSFIENTQSCNAIKDLEQAKEVGYALGLFHNLISDLPSEKLADTLEGFHITPLYLQHHNAVLKKKTHDNSPEVQYCLKFVDERKELAHVLENAKAKGRLPLRPIHGDPKVNNVMIDALTGKAVSIIDLDTVKPGLVHYDIGDCIRSGCNPLGEETEQLEAVRFEPDICKAILSGYISQAKNFLGESEYDFIYDAIRLITFELGLRFFTDYLEGNIYFKVRHEKNNLFRALVQFRLAESIETNEKNIQKIIKNLK
jgi:Ser/Thr protein kinase RdoA (MazF antagonist)